MDASKQKGLIESRKTYGIEKCSRDNLRAVCTRRRVLKDPDIIWVAERRKYAGATERALRCA